MSRSTNTYTVKPVYNGHPWDLATSPGQAPFPEKGLVQIYCPHMLQIFMEFRETVISVRLSILDAKTSQVGVVLTDAR